ncbi:MAG: efflux RND transporter periplasmic adaptor subunit [Gemmataceae bacterium]
MSHPASCLLACTIALGAFLVAGCGSPSPPAPAAALSLEISANGVIEGAQREVALRPEMEGVLAQLHVKEHQEVEAGQLLFSLKSETACAQMELARAELEAARAESRHADQLYQRSSRLVARAAISAESYEADQFQQALARARVARAEAQLALARAELAKSQVRAPCRGTVVQILLEPGASVGLHGVPVLRFVDLSKRRVRAFVEELDVDRLALGQPARITIDGIPGRTFDGKVSHLALRMGKTTIHDDAPEEYKDVYFREILIELEGGASLPIHLRVHVKIECARH